MNITSLLLCRGDLKIYEKLRVEGVAGDHVLMISYQDTTELPQVPCELYTCSSPELPAGTREICVVSPQIRRNKACFYLTELDAAAKEVALMQWTIDYTKATWTSRLNYRLRPGLCRDLKLVEKKKNPISSRLTVLSLIPDHASQEMVLRLELRTAFLPETQLCVRLFDERLEPISHTCIPMGSPTTDSDSSPYILLRMYRYSLRLPLRLKQLSVLVYSHRYPDIYGTVTLRKQAILDLLNTSNKLFTAADTDPYYPAAFKSRCADYSELQMQRHLRLSLMPCFSIVVPLYQTPIPFFWDMVNSVCLQSYQNWELVLVNASPGETRLTAALAEAMARDSRIKTVELPNNLGISENTNAGIRASSGDFIAFLDHDDILEPDTLFCYAQAVSSEQEIDLIYCDEDKLFENGVYGEVFYKPEFNVDLLRTHNYLAHFLCIRTSLLNKLDLPDHGYDGAQDYHLTLQAVEKARIIKHISRVLYHWRVTGSSTAKNAGAKTYTVDAGIRALQAHFERLGIAAQVAPHPHPELQNRYNVSYELPNPAPMVSIIIPTCDAVSVLSRCVDSIFKKSTYQNFEILLVENNSKDPKTFACYEELEHKYGERIHVLSWLHPGFNFAALCNFGAAHAQGDYLLLLNNDTEVISEDWLEQLVSNCARPEIGAVGAKLYYPDNTIQHAGVVISDDGAAHLGLSMPRNSLGYHGFFMLQRNISAVTGACLMVKKNDYDAVKGMDEDFAVAFNDIDFCLKLLKNGKLNLICPQVELFHYESFSRGDDTSPEKTRRFIHEHGMLFSRWSDFYAQGDPCFSPNLRGGYPLSSYYHL